MEAMLIPPIPELPNFGIGTSLLLSHLLHRKNYRLHYEQERIDNQPYLILDNSAHEFQSGQPAELLLTQITDFPVSEVVAPDVLFDCEGTLGGCQTALDLWSQSEEFLKLHPHVMLVPQGKDYQSWQRCLYELLTIYEQSLVKFPAHFYAQPVIGLSKDYEMWEGGLYRILEDHLVPLIHFDSIPVHLLGWGRDLWALNRIGRDFGKYLPLLRGVDSAKPFVYAASLIELDPAQPPPEYPKRSEGYFDIWFNEKQREVAERNVVIFEACAAGEL